MLTPKISSTHLLDAIVGDGEVGAGLQQSVNATKYIYRAERYRPGYGRCCHLLQVHFIVCQNGC